MHGSWKQSPSVRDKGRSQLPRTTACDPNPSSAFATESPESSRSLSGERPNTPRPWLPETGHALLVAPPVAALGYGAGAEAGDARGLPFSTT
jgi:hypothetical protein